MASTKEKGERTDRQGTVRDPDLPPASWTGRLGKLIVGLLQLLAVGQLLFFFPLLLERSWPPTVWLVVALGFWLLPFAVGLGFAQVREVGRRPLWLALGVALLLLGGQVLLRRPVMAPPLTAYLLAVALYVHLHVGLCHVLAALVGIPGCEMRVLPYLWHRMSGGGRETFHPCPGLWGPVDRWEARLRSEEQT